MCGLVVLATLGVFFWLLIITVFYTNLVYLYFLNSSVGVSEPVLQLLFWRKIHFLSLQVWIIMQQSWFWQFNTGLYDLEAAEKWSLISFQKSFNGKKKGKIKPNRTQTDAMSFWLAVIQSAVSSTDICFCCVAF